MMAAWKCPVCNAPYDKCGKKDKAMPRHGPEGCQGLICECEEDMDDKDHGNTQENPCENATCYHCGWGGTLPVPNYKFKGWAKKAWDAGWRPPRGWDPPDNVVGK